jgi:hypothetical protein
MCGCRSAKATERFPPLKGIFVDLFIYCLFGNDAHGACDDGLNGNIGENPVSILPRGKTKPLLQALDLFPLGTDGKAAFGHQGGDSGNKAEAEDAGNQRDNDGKQSIVNHYCHFERFTLR